MTGLCRDCEHWDTIAPKIEGDCQLAFGEKCQEMPLNGMRGYYLDERVTGHFFWRSYSVNMLDAHVKTGPDFGCIHFEARKP